jgi:hypothetical protein
MSDGEHTQHIVTHEDHLVGERSDELTPESRTFGMGHDNADTTFSDGADDVIDSLGKTRPEAKALLFVPANGVDKLGLGLFVEKDRERKCHRRPVVRRTSAQGTDRAAPDFMSESRFFTSTAHSSS